MPDWVHTLGFDKKHWKNWFLQQPVDPNEESEHGDYQKIEGFQIFADPYKSIKYLEGKASKKMKRLACCLARPFASSLLIWIHPLLIHFRIFTFYHESI
jgi:hypothetical protein|tara:strand:+ start:70 stop:366 length:297 start_codon:yes stop_codon:yes gene_type:complete